MIRYLTEKQIIQTHDVLIDEWGGQHGGGPRGSSYEGVEAALWAVRNSHYQSLAELAAAHAVYIVQGHVFADGNKRTGAAVLTSFMEINGIAPKIGIRALFDAMIEVQERFKSGERTDQLIAWLAGKIA